MQGTLIRNGKSYSSGVTAVEAAIIMPFFLTLIYGIIYLALYLSIQGILDTAATRALTVASTSADFEITGTNPPICGEDSTESFCLGIKSLKTEIQRMASSAFVSPSEGSSGLAYLTGQPTITWPQATGSVSYDQALQVTPITIEVTANLRTFLPFMPSFKVVGRAAGFREIRKALSYPVVTDCNGYPIGHSMYQQRPCVCTTPNSSWNPTRQACEVCDQGRAVPTINPTTGAMSGPSGFLIITPVPAYNRPAQFCACPNDATCLSRHGGNAILNWNTCRCMCSGAASSPSYPLASDPTTGTYQHCDPCPGTPPTYISPSGFNFVFTGYTRTVVNGREACACDPKITDQNCRDWFPSIANNIKATSDGCSCWCLNYHCDSSGNPSSTPRPSNGSPGDGDPSIIYWNPTNGNCACRCLDSNGHDRLDRHKEGGDCVCNNPCPGGIRTRDPNADCSDSSCRCPADPPCGAGQIKNDADPNCGCINASSNTGN